MSETPVSNEKQNPAGSIMPGVACLGCAAVGVVALVLALIAAFTFEQFAGAGACLASAALAFGLLANATLRQ